MRNEIKTTHSSPNNCFLFLLTSAVGDDVCEGVAAVHDGAAQLRRIVAEVSVCAQGAGWAEGDGGK